jgi:hypothetical protein
LVSKPHNILEDGQVERQFSIVTGGTGLTRTFRTGFFVRGDVVNTVPQADVTVTDDDVTYVYIDTNTFLIASALAIPVEDFVMLYELTAASGVITVTLDWRHSSHGIKDT